MTRSETPDRDIPFTVNNALRWKFEGEISATIDNAIRNTVITSTVVSVSDQINIPHHGHLTPALRHDLNG